MQLLNYPSLAVALRKVFNPGECYAFWEYYSKGFSEPCKDLVSDDLSIMMKRNIQTAMAQITTRKRNRLLLKITGWPRIGFLSEVFDDAKFIHVIRDGRAVANSFINIGFWRGWGGPENWRWGPLSKAYQDEWNKHDQSFIALAAIQWKILMDSAEMAKTYVEANRIMEIQYEQLCAEPIPTMREVARFCELEWNEPFEAGLRRHELLNTNFKYKEELNSRQQEILNDVLGDSLSRYGYL